MNLADLGFFIIGCFVRDEHPSPDWGKYSFVSYYYVWFCLILKNINNKSWLSVEKYCIAQIYIGFMVTYCMYKDSPSSGFPLFLR